VPSGDTGIVHIGASDSQNVTWPSCKTTFLDSKSAIDLLPRKHVNHQFLSQTISQITSPDFCRNCATTCAKLIAPIQTRKPSHNRAARAILQLALADCCAQVHHDGQHQTFCTQRHVKIAKFALDRDRETPPTLKNKPKVANRRQIALEFCTKK
jgi:hypothetical protein